MHVYREGKDSKLIFFVERGNRISNSVQKLGFTVNLVTVTMVTINLATVSLLTVTMVAVTLVATVCLVTVTFPTVSLVTALFFYYK